MKTFWNILIVFLLLLLITLVLLNNKKETDLKIEFAEREIENVPVRVAEIEEGTIPVTLSFTDIITPITEMRINAPVQGRIVQVFAKEGAAIGKNELLIKTDDEYIQAEFEVDKQNYELAKKNLNRVEKLSDENAVPKNQYEQISVQAESAEIKMALTEKRLNETWVRSPTNGFVNQIYVKEGMLINPSVPIGEIVDLSKFKVSLFVSEKEVTYLKPKMDVEISFPSALSERFQGKITSVAVNADFALQYKVVVEFENKTDWLKGGMVCHIKVLIEDDKPGLIVPASAISRENDLDFIFVVNNGVAERKKVTILAEGNDRIKMSGNISKGEKVVVEGQSILEPGRKVKIITEKE